MEAAEGWKRGVYLVGSREAPNDGASYFLVFSYWGAGLYLVDPWPLKPEGPLCWWMGGVGYWDPRWRGFLTLTGKPGS